MKKIICFLISILVIIGCFGLCACKEENTKTEAQRNYEACILSLKSKLKDPDSLRVDLVWCYEITSIDTEHSYYEKVKNHVAVGDFIYKIYYNAKNSFGGYGTPATMYFRCDSANGTVYEITGVAHFPVIDIEIGSLCTTFARDCGVEHEIDH